MTNQKSHIGIIGAGKIGSAINNLMIGGDLGYEVAIADQFEHNTNFSNYHCVKIGRCTDSLNEFVRGKDVIVNALPFHLNIDVWRACLNENVPYFDLSEDDALDVYISEQVQIRETIPFTMPHCGLAPGISTVIADSLTQKYNTINDVKIRVGALSQHASNKLKYHTSWSGDGLVNEYKGMCQTVFNGKYQEVKALNGYELLTIDGHDYEAFNTAGGIGTYAKTLAGQETNSINANYKTIRRIGHHNYVDFLFNDLKLCDSTLVDIFKNHVSDTRDDCVIIYVVVSGIDMQDNKTESTYAKLFYPDFIHGRRYTAIELTTAAGLIGAVELFTRRILPQEGYYRQEDMSYKKYLETRLGKLVYNK